MKLLLTLNLILLVQGKKNVCRNWGFDWGSAWSSQPWSRQGSLPDGWAESTHPVEPPLRPLPPNRPNPPLNHPNQPALRPSPPLANHTQTPPTDHRTDHSGGPPVGGIIDVVGEARQPMPIVTASADRSAHVPTPTPGRPDLASLPRDPTYERFCEAVDAYSMTQWRDHPPKPSRTVYEWYQDIVARNMSLSEQAMFLANIVWETAGLQFREELACRTGNCTYGKYFGRGYIQLTWEYNYRDASYDLFGDDRLLRNPEQVAEVEGGWRTSLWYWRRHVTPRLIENNALMRYALGYSVMAINGAVECTPKSYRLDRLHIYNAILAAWGLHSGNPGTMAGCHVETKMGPRKIELEDLTAVTDWEVNLVETSLPTLVSEPTVNW